MIEGWTWLLIQVENVFCLEMIRKRLGNQGKPKPVRSLACGGEISQSQAFPSLAAWGVALWVTQDGGTLGAGVLWLLVSDSEAPFFLLRPAPPVGPDWPPLLPCLRLPQEHTPPCGVAVYTLLLHQHINSVSPTFRTKAGLQLMLNKIWMKKSVHSSIFIFINSIGCFL